MLTLQGFGAGIREASERRYSCDICGKRYSQQQGVSRHRRKAHNNPHSCCVLRCKFKWTRPDLYRSHLEKQHPDVNPDEVLGKPAGSRRRSAIIGRDIQQRFPPPAVGPRTGQWSRAEPRLRPMTPLLPAVADVTHAPLPAIIPLSYDPQPEYAEPAITKCKHEDVRGFVFHGGTDASSASSSTEESHWQSVNDLDTFIQGGQIWLDILFYTPHM